MDYFKLQKLEFKQLINDMIIKFCKGNPIISNENFASMESI